MNRFEKAISNWLSKKIRSTLLKFGTFNMTIFLKRFCSLIKDPVRKIIPWLLCELMLSGRGLTVGWQKLQWIPGTPYKNYAIHFASEPSPIHPGSHGNFVSSAPWLYLQLCANKCIRWKNVFCKLILRVLARKHITIVHMVDLIYSEYHVFAGWCVVDVIHL